MQLHAVIGGQGAATATVVAAPGPDVTVVVDAFSLSVGAVATKVTLGFSASNQKVFNLAVNGNIAQTLERWEGDPGSALTLTTSAAGPTECTVDFHFEAVDARAEQVMPRRVRAAHSASPGAAAALIFDVPMAGCEPPSDFLTEEQNVL